MRFDIRDGPPCEIRAELDALIERHNVQSVVEIGSFLGSSAAFFAGHEQIRTVTCIDPFEDHGPWSQELAVRGIPNPFYGEFEANLREMGLWDKIRVIRGRSQDVAAQVPRADLVYVDGDHSFTGCAADIALYLPKARKVICGDDHHAQPDGTPYFPGVVRAVEELLSDYLVVGAFWWKEITRDPDINVIVFSKNRAMQLDALLRSMQKFAPRLYPPTVIYLATDPDYLRAYNTLHTERRECRWIIQGKLKHDVLRTLDRSRDLTCFYVDDDVFFRPLPEIRDVEPGTAYAPRLGKNCTWCYNRQEPMREGQFDFDCSLSLDGHIYRTEEILPHLEAVTFDTPNQLEDALWRIARFRLIYPEHSCVVGIPHNLVGEYPNRNAGGNAAELNRLFLAGQRINLDHMDFTKVNAVHQEIPYVFTKIL